MSEDAEIIAETTIEDDLLNLTRKLDEEYSPNTASLSPLDDANNPYAYLDRDEFTSEKFKIEIRGLPKYYGISELRKLLNNKLQLASNKLKTPRRRSPWAYVCFRNDEDKAKAIDIITGYKWKGNTLSARDAKPMRDPLVQKRKDNEDKRNNRKKIKFEGTIEERLQNSTIPLANTPYEEQLKIKQQDVKNILAQLGTDLIRINPDLKDWVEKNQKIYDGLPCELWNVRYAEQTEGYRNKCEFSIGKHEESGLPTIGFRLGSYATGSTCVGPVESLKHIPERMKKAVEVLEKYIRRSDLEVFDPEVQSGNFKQLTARYASATNQLMLVIGVCPQKLTAERLEELKKDLTQFFSEGEGKAADVTSLYYHKLVKKTAGNDLPKAEHLLGEQYIHETMLGLKFRISPEAFFQINTKAAEVLYNSAIELAAPTLDSTVVDICCGTGTIGLCFAKKCGQVLGVELIEQAVMDAKENAVENDIDNADFFCGKAEEILSSVMHRATKKDVIAIVDPPRAGLHNKALEQLRKNQKLNKLVYISCNPQSASKNFVHLGRSESKTLHGNPLVPIRAVSVDMFPHTKHCELIIYFERFQDSE